MRKLRKLVDEALISLEGLFESTYAQIGKVSVAPERLTRASLLQVLYSIRNERQLVAQIQYIMLYRWFVGLEMDDSIWHPSTFSKKKRERLLNNRVLPKMFGSVLAMARKRQLHSE